MVGVGLGILISKFLENATALIILLGVVMHVWGMIDMSRLDKLAGDVSRPAWSSALYWICWIALATLLLYIITL